MLRVVLGSFCAALVGACGLSVVGAEPVTTTADAGASTTSAPDSGTSTPDAGALVGTSCKDLLQKNPVLKNHDGVQTVDSDGAGPNPPFQVWCDMTTDGGGWTLAGRSAAGGGGEFGWSTRVGTPDDTTKPYALDVYDAGILFEDVLVRGGENVFKLAIPASFDQLTNATALAQTTGATTLAGDCAPSGTPPGPAMLDWLGNITSTGGFFFRNGAAFDAAYGLGASGWDTYFDNCDDGGNIKGKQGSLLIR